MGDDEVGTGGRGRGDDAFEGLTLDDSFVRGAALNEGSHRDREKDARRQHRKHRRGNRLRRTGRWFTRYAPLLLAAVVLVAAVGFGSRGQGPLGQLDAIRRLGGLEPVASARDDVGSSNAPGGTAVATSTTLTLSAVRAEPGTCLTWDQTPGGPGNRRSTAVPCEEEHLFEATSSYQIDGEPYGEAGPTAAEWATVMVTACASRAEEFLGYPLDVEGRFRPSAILPTEQGWRAGDRQVLCGIGVAPPAGEPGIETISVPFTGPVKGASQTLLREVGVCLDGRSDADLGSAVDCAGPHATEVVGYADVSVLGDAYPGVEAIGDAARDACRSAAIATYGAPLGPGVGFGWMLIPESSWAAGTRELECLLGLRDDAGWITGTGPVRAAGA